MSFNFCDFTDFFLDFKCLMIVKSLFETNHSRNPCFTLEIIIFSHVVILVTFLQKFEITKCNFGAHFSKISKSDKTPFFLKVLMVL